MVESHRRAVFAMPNNVCFLDRAKHHESSIVLDKASALPHVVGGTLPMST